MNNRTNEQGLFKVDICSSCLNLLYGIFVQHFFVMYYVRPVGLSHRLHVNFLAQTAVPFCCVARQFLEWLPKLFIGLGSTEYHQYTVQVGLKENSSSWYLPEGTQHSLIRGWKGVLHPEVQPHNLSNTISFPTEKVPLSQDVYLPLPNGTTFTYLVWNAVFLLNAVNALYILKISFQL